MVDVLFHRPFYLTKHLSQKPIEHADVAVPARPDLVDITITEHTIELKWSLEGAADTIHIWNEPVDGSCSKTSEGYCEVDVKTAKINITDLVAGQGYFLSFGLRN